ncbi:MAG TPA: AraC family transcriptional regulator [Candidatus Erysipelatoclostridium merdavium]|uniref:AraC family transcriptional regulator n=1 Tax=Candidatus Erysipelatoclostridium merdavium TaxID=2838566 RepID=A0A9D1XMF0_9FIRM|nr:AraC family transcriptional regulator [Candidatus Erysipelatoclostridium merdavium]
MTGIFKYEKIEHDHNLPTKLLDFYFEDYQGDFVDKHWHRSIEILVPLFGSFNLWVDGSEILLKEGQLYIVHSQVIHMIIPNNKERYYKGYALQIDYDFIKKCYLEIDDIYFKQPNSINNRIILNKVLEIIKYYDDTNQYNSVRLISVVEMLVFLLLDNLACKKNDNLKIKNNKYKNRVIEILKYIEDNYTEDLSAIMISKKFDVSEGYLYKIFKENLNISLKHYINQVRLDHAKNDLINSDYPIIDIAIMSGFPNVKSFNNCFREKMGISPKEYRKKMRK